MKLFRLLFNCTLLCQALICTQAEFVPYREVRLHCARRGETYLLTGLTALAADGTREIQFNGYQEIAPGRFRPQQVVVWDGSTGRTELTLQHWQLDAASPDLFTKTALETKSLTLTAQGRGEERGAR
jgi:hypothetical protein